MVVLKRETIYCDFGLVLLPAVFNRAQTAVEDFLDRFMFILIYFKFDKNVCKVSNHGY